MDKEKELAKLLHQITPLYPEIDVEEGVLRAVAIAASRRERARKYYHYGLCGVGLFVLLCVCWLWATYYGFNPPWVGTLDGVLIPSVLLMILFFIQLELSWQRPAQRKSSIKSLSILLLFPLLLQGGNLAGQTTTKVSLEKSDAAITTFMEERLAPIPPNSPGVAVSVLRNGESVYSEQWGLANLEYRLPLSDSSVFDLASLAKQFTGYAIALLLEEGKLQLTDDIHQYLPEVPLFTDPITIDHLLHHTSGLKDVGELYGIGNFGANFTSKEVLRIVHKQEALNFPPGSRHVYSNTGYVLLAVIVERVTGQSFPAWCQQHIFQPLGMKTAFANDNPQQLIPNRAVAYNGTLKEYHFEQNNGMSLIGSSAVFATIKDLEVWSKYVLKGLKEEEAIWNRMVQPGRLSDGTPIGYGFGLNVMEYSGKQLITHGGSSPAGFKTLLLMIPEEQLSVIVLSNWGGFNPREDIGRPLVDFLFQPQQKQREDRMRELTTEATVILSKEAAMAVTGSYLFNDEREVEISHENDEFFIEISGIGKSPLWPRSATEFWLPAMNSNLFFSFKDESVEEVLIKEEGNTVGRLIPKRQERTYNLPTGISGTYYSRELDLLFQVSVSKGIISLESGKHGILLPRQIGQLDFTIESEVFTNMRFVKNSENEIVGFQLDLGARAMGLKFNKLPDSLLIAE